MLKFTKMHGLGNDFVVVSALDAPVSLSAAQVRHIAERRLGVGCDQLLLLEHADDERSLCRYRVFNADGLEAGQCGNGVRCIALYLSRRGLAPEGPMQLTGPAGPVRVEPAGGDRFRVDMGPPRLDPGAVPFRAERRAASYALTAAGRELEIGAVSMGNPHAVLRVPAAAEADVALLGPAIERHERFPENANVGFREVLARDAVRLRVHERGVGETRACGSGACAAVVAGRLRGWLDETVEVALPGGNLVIKWRGNGASVWMTGPATSVFEGEIDI